MQYRSLYILWIIILFISCRRNDEESINFIETVQAKIGIDIRPDLEDQGFSWKNDSTSDLIILIKPNNKSYYTNKGYFEDLDSVLKKTVEHKNFVVLIPDEKMLKSNFNSIYDVYAKLLEAMRIDIEDKSKRMFGKSFEDIRTIDKRKVKKGGVPFYLYLGHFEEGYAEKVTKDFYNYDSLHKKGLLLFF